MFILFLFINKTILKGRMDFENIFEKYKKECKVSKTTRKYSATLKQFFKNNNSQKHSLLNKIYGFHKTNSSGDNTFKENNTIRNTANSVVSRTSFILNKTKRNKDLKAVHKKPLEVIAVQKLQTSCSKAENFSETDMTLTSTDDSCSKTENQSQIRKIPLMCSFNLRNTTNRERKITKLSQLKPLDISRIPKQHNIDSPETALLPSGKSNFDLSSDNNLDVTFNPFLSSSPKPSQFIENSVSIQNSDNKELTELIDLIEQQDRENSLIKQTKIQKRCRPKVLKGGLEDIFQKALTRASTVGRFLKYNRKFGVQGGLLLAVVDVYCFYGTTFVMVKSDTCVKPFGIVVSPEMVPTIQTGTKLEAFFDDTTTPYELKINNEVLDIYLKPYKLLVV